MKRLSLKLDTKSIEKTVKELEKYRDSLSSKSEQFINRLMDEGIKVAYQHLGRYTGYVEFTKEITNDGTHYVGVLIGENSKPFINTWKVKSGEKSVEVNSILMAEFGSGWLANVIWDVSGVRNIYGKFLDVLYNGVFISIVCVNDQIPVITVSFFEVDSNNAG